MRARPQGRARASVKLGRIPYGPPSISVVYTSAGTAHADLDSLGENRENILSHDFLDLSELLHRRPPRAATIRRLDIRRQDRCHGRAPEEAMQEPVTRTAPFSKYDRETAWGIAAALSLPKLPACQTLLVMNGSYELLSNMIQATPNVLELRYVPASPFAHPITSRLDCPF